MSLSYYLIFLLTQFNLVIGYSKIYTASFNSRKFVSTITNEYSVIISNPYSLSESISNSKSDMLIEFVKSSCPKCEEMAPIFERISKQISVVNIRSFVLEVNKSTPLPDDDYLRWMVDRVMQDGFPTYFFIPCNNKLHAKAFDGKLDEISLLLWIKGLSTTSDLDIDIPDIANASNLILIDDDDDCDACSL